MNLDSLLKEYRDQLPNAPALDFEALIQRESARKSRRNAFAWVGLAAAACLAVVLFFPRTSATNAIPIIETTANVGTLYELAPVISPGPPPERRLPKRRERRTELLTGFVALAETRMLPEPRLLQLLRIHVSGKRLAALGVMAPNQAVSPR